MKIKLAVAIGFILILLGGGLYFLNQDKLTAHIPAASSFATTLKDWKIVFSEQMNPDTFTDDSIKVTNEKNDVIPVSFQWNKDYTILTLVAPDGGYKPDETYDISISKRVEALSGNHLKKPYSHTFTASSELPTIKNKQQLTQLLNERNKLSPYDSVEESTVENDSKAEMAADQAGGDNVSASATNVQVAGIDEGDAVKTDGEYIYFSRDTDIIIAKADQSESSVISHIHENDYYPIELYVHNHLLISIGHAYHSLREEEQMNAKNQTHDEDTFPLYHSQTTIFLYDITDKSNPKRMREVTIEGGLTASRKMDGYLYFVLNNYPPYHILEESGIDARPFFKDTADNPKSQPIQYDNLYFFPDSYDGNFLILVSLDLNQPEKEVLIESYFGASEQLYMSKNNMYITVSHFNEGPSADHTNMVVQPADTEIFQFGINDGKMTYKNSTIVNGTLINQFAMDERNETFRVATTKGDMWDEKKPSTNNIYTFDLNLNSLGAAEGLAEGERIYSIRFMEDVAYMVTFKQIDPLFVIDLKDPIHPKVLGELKIPGFSNYLHPLDENHVIGFGQHTEVMPAKSTEEPIVRLNGLKISVFDVSDPASPKEKFSEIIGQGGSHSEVNYNHKALYQHPAQSVFGFPAVLYDTKTVTRGDATYQEESFVYEGAFLYEITADKGISLKDTITHQEKVANDPYYDWWPSQIVRMVSVDDTLYTLSYDKMKIYDLMEEKEVQTIDLPKMVSAY